MAATITYRRSPQDPEITFEAPAETADQIVAILDTVARYFGTVSDPARDARYEQIIRDRERRAKEPQQPKSEGKALKFGATRIPGSGGDAEREEAKANVRKSALENAARNRRKG